MLVRHNTSLLEQAIDLQVKRSAIPTLEAEAAAYDKIARANAFRRMATGAAIAIAAVGIGVGAMLIFDEEPEQTPEEVAEKQPEATNPQEPAKRRTPEEPVEKPLPTTKQGERVAEEGKSTRPRAENPPSQPQDRSSTPPPPDDPAAPPNPVTLDFTKFVHRDVFY